jgi:hypothetical protein
MGWDANQKKKVAPRILKLSAHAKNSFVAIATDFHLATLFH